MAADNPIRLTGRIASFYFMQDGPSVAQPWVQPRAVPGTPSHLALSCAVDGNYDVAQSRCTGDGPGHTAGCCPLGRTEQLQTSTNARFVAGWAEILSGGTGARSMGLAL
eukprot:362672-Chlamydomonas_euryale.AAC.10